MIKSELYDNPIANIKITFYELHLAWAWNTDKRKIVRTGAAYAKRGYFRLTGWGYTGGRGGPFLYAPTLNANGKWVKQGMEGWQQYSISGAYEHEHRIIQWVTRYGDCGGENHFYGTIPGQAYQKFKVLTEPYER